MTSNTIVFAMAGTAFLPPVISESALRADRSVVAALAQAGSDGPNASIISASMSRVDDITTLDLMGNVRISQSGQPINIYLPTLANANLFIAAGQTSAYVQITNQYLPQSAWTKPLYYQTQSSGLAYGVGGLINTSNVAANVGSFVLWSDINLDAFATLNDNVILNSQIIYT